MKNSNEKKQGAATAEELAAKQIKKLEAELNRTKKQLKRAEKKNKELATELDAMRIDRDFIKEQYSVISNSETWKITKPFRWILDLIKRILYAFPPTRLLGKTLKMLKRNGWRATKLQIRNYMKKRKLMRKKQKIDWSKISPERREKEMATVFEKKILFSILVPLYNTPIKFLDEMIASVVDQTYAGWELCLADGSDEAHSDVERAVEHWLKKDGRIKYCKLEKNLGISENTNACIDMATGNYIALFDHDDVLHPSALFEMMKAICEQDADFIYTDENTFSDQIAKAFCPHYKPDFSPDTFRSYNYICHFVSFSKELQEKVGRFRPEFDGSQDYDMLLRLTEQAEHIVHIPQILYFWRAHQNSVASDISAKPYTLVTAKKALGEHLKRVGLPGKVVNSKVPSTYRIKYQLKEKPLVSIIIPNMDHVKILRQCINSVEKLSTYPNYEIIIVENNSKKKETFEYYENVCERYSNVRVVYWEAEFNYSKINNFAVKEAKGEYLIFLNNDIKIITPGWIEEMLMFNQRAEVGAVGMMLYYPDDTVQHAGVILGIGGVAGHAHKYFPKNSFGYMSRLTIAQNMSAVTAASMMVKTSVFREIGGFDESLAVAFNDVDLCLKIRNAGHLIVFTPYAEAYHYESKSRGLEDTAEKQKRFNGEVDRIQAKWPKVFEAGDPYYNPNLTLEFEDFRLK